jgi:hypothetical protein
MWLYHPPRSVIWKKAPGIWPRLGNISQSFISSLTLLIQQAQRQEVCYFNISSSLLLASFTKNRYTILTLLKHTGNYTVTCLIYKNCVNPPPPQHACTHTDTVYLCISGDSHNKQFVFCNVGYELLNMKVHFVSYVYLMTLSQLYMFHNIQWYDEHEWQIEKMWNVCEPADGGNSAFSWTDRKIWEETSLRIIIVQAETPRMCSPN